MTRRRRDPQPILPQTGQNPPGLLPLEYLHRASLQGAAGALTEIKFAESVSGADDVAKN